MTRDTIVAAAADEFATLIGSRESQGLEVKSQWPDVTKATERWEFAKDVAAMANGGGGLIVYGLKTKRVPAEKADEVAAVTLLDSSTDREAGVGILVQHIVPALQGLELEFVESHKTKGQGVILVVVPAQTNKVLLCKVMEGTESLKEFIFGFVERDREDTRNWKREDIARMIQSGTDSVSVRLESIEKLLARIASSSSASNQQSADKEFEARLQNMMRND